jgi:Sulfotransferase family
LVGTETARLNIKMQIPDTIYIGQQKTGSTYLRSYFSQHPDISWTRNATMFQFDPFVSEQYLGKFKDEKKRGCLVDMYEGLAVGYHFAGGIQWQPELALDPDSILDGNAMVPGQRDTAERIKSVLPEARILITLRNQIDWLRSNYLHYLLGLPANKRRFIDFLQTREGKLLLAAGTYDQLLNCYHKIFGMDKVHVILLEELALDERKVLEDLCKFLGVDYTPLNPAAREHNTGIGAGRGALIKFYSTLGFSDDMARRIRPWFLWMERTAAKWLQAPALSDEEEAMIRAYYAVSNYHTARLLGRDMQPLGYTC